MIEQVAHWTSKLEKVVACNTHGPTVRFMHKASDKIKCCLAWMFCIASSSSKKIISPPANASTTCRLFAQAFSICFFPGARHSCGGCPFMMTRKPCEYTFGTRGIRLSWFVPIQACISLFLILAAIYRCIISIFLTKTNPTHKCSRNTNWKKKYRVVHGNAFFAFSANVSVPESRRGPWITPAEFCCSP